MISPDFNHRAVEAKADIERELRLLEAEDAEDARSASEPRFEIVGEGRYRYERLGIAVEIDFLRRTGGALRGEVIIKTTIPGARTSDGTLSAEDLNISSSRARRSFGLHLKERSKVDDFDWVGLVEDVCIRVLAAERSGQPAVILSDLPRPAPDESLEVDGLSLLARHPTIMFGDGGTTKSYLALYFGGSLARRGVRVLLSDWELCGEDHRDRLERLFGEDMPTIHYMRCTRPLVVEADRLRRAVREKGINFCIFDSVAFACDGPPEAAETAGRYFQSLRSLGTVGSLHVAHVTKAFEGSDQKPFGSTFWHNGARSTWNVKLADTIPDEAIVSVALHNKKANLRAKRPSVGFEFTFTPDRTNVRRIDVGDVPDLAAGLPVRQRMVLALRRGAMSPEVLAGEIEAEPATVSRTARRYRQQFTVLEGGRLALLETRT